MFRQPPTKQSEKSNPKCYILLPTKVEYLSRDENGIKLDPTNFNVEMDKLQHMGEFDAKYFKKNNYEVTCLYTGYSHVDKSPTLAGTVQSLADLPKTQADSILICFTGHGSPGAQGKIGTGSDNLQSQKYNYRVSIDELITLLMESGFNQLKDHHLHFEFHCCNSAYVPFQPLVEDKFYLKRHKIELPEADQVQFENDILEKSLIGIFYKTMKENGFNHIVVSGLRGYYCPSTTTSEVSAEFPAKKKYKAEDCIIHINSNGKVEANFLKVLRIANIPELDQYFPTKKVVAEKKS